LDQPRDKLIEILWYEEINLKPNKEVNMFPDILKFPSREPSIYLNCNKEEIPNPKELLISPLKTNDPNDQFEEIEDNIYTIDDKEKLDVALFDTARLSNGTFTIEQNPL
jgi:hypothetical protein